MDIEKAFQSTLFDKLGNTERKNGFVNDIYKESGSAPFLQYLEAGAMQPVKNDGQNVRVKHELLTGNRGSDPVSELFFSAKNVDALQNGIRYVVFKRTQGKRVIGQQSTNGLLTIMRYVYSLKTSTYPYMYVEQVRALNASVIDEAVGSILRELEMYDKYLHDSANIPYRSMDPVNVSSKGEKTLELKNFI